MTRVGIGVDIHRFVPGRRLVIGGVAIPYVQGLEGHSDADVLAHALGDALLGAAALGDIGHFYPDTDPKFKDMDSMIILREVGEKLRQQGSRIANVDVAIVAQVPKLAPHIPQMQKIVAQNLAISPNQVGIKATTSEWLGFTGRKEGIIAVAVAAVES